MTDSDKILDRIRKLLAMAEDNATTPAEAEAFTAKASELIAKYGIDEALATARDATRDAVADRIIRVDAPYQRDKATLLACVAEPLRCKVIYHSGGKVVHLFGYGADLDRVELLYTSLLVQAAHALAATYVRVPWDEDVRAFRRSWYRGFATAVYERLKAAEHRAEAQAEPAQATAGRSVALVLADRSAVVQRAMDAAYPDARKARTRKLSGSGGRAGYRAGQRADLGGTRLTQRAAGQISQGR